MDKKLLVRFLGLSTTSLLVLASVTSTGAIEVTKLGLDSADGLATTLTTDTEVKFEGEGSVRISTVWPVTICLSEVSGIDIEKAVLIYRAKVKSENLEGQAFLEMWCHVGGGQYFSRGLNSFVSGTSDWTTLETPFVLQAGQRAEKVTLNIVINGRGTVWIDDALLSTQPLN